MIELLVKKNLKESLLFIRKFILILSISSLFIIIFNINNLQSDEFLSNAPFTIIPYFTLMAFINILNIDYYSNDIGGNSAIENLPITKRDYIVSRYLLIPMHCLTNLALCSIIMLIFNRNIINILETKFNMNIFVFFFNSFILLVFQMSISAFFTYGVSPKGAENCAFFTAFIFILSHDAFMKALGRYDILKASTIFLLITLFIYWQSFKLSISAFEITDFKGGETDYEQI